MPYKPLKPCKHLGCPRLSDQPYCEIHRKAARAESNRLYDRNSRDKELQKFYASTAWRNLRKQKLAATPYCEICFAAGRMTKATIVDHIVPIKDDYARRLDMTNMQSCCQSCHSRKTRKEEARRRKTSFDDPDYRF